MKRGILDHSQQVAEGIAHRTDPDVTAHVLHRLVIGGAQLDQPGIGRGGVRHAPVSDTCLGTIMHGVLTVVYGLGVMIVGDSGTGKSECGLELVKRGHILVSDDVVEVRHYPGDVLVGSSGPLLQHYMEVRGLGIIDVKQVFGVASVKDSARIELVVRLETSKDDGNYARVGLDKKFAMMSPADLSGGMRKRVGLARAIAIEPEILFFDEPTTGIDPIMGDIINELIVKCVEETGATALTITHDMASARKISDRIAMLYKGRIVWAGPTAEIDRSDNGVVQQFIHGRAEGPIEIDVRRL